MAKLVVQLPSQFDGGDIAVLDERMGEYRCYALGRYSGAAEFQPDYVVYAADAKLSLDKVTRGYRVLLIYSLTLPSPVGAPSGKSAIDLLRMQLRDAIKQLNSDEASILAGRDIVDSLAAANARFILMLYRPYK